MTSFKFLLRHRCRVLVRMMVTVDYRPFANLAASLTVTRLANSFDAIGGCRSIEPKLRYILLIRCSYIPIGASHHEER
jgi:hypothetical protein